MVLKILGIVLVIWVAFSLLGAVFEFLTWALVIGAVVFVGAAGVLGRQGPQPAVAGPLGPGSARDQRRVAVVVVQFRSTYARTRSPAPANSGELSRAASCGSRFIAAASPPLATSTSSCRSSACTVRSTSARISFGSGVHHRGARAAHRGDGVGQLVRRHVAPGQQPVERSDRLDVRLRRGAERRLLAAVWCVTGSRRSASATEPPQPAITAAATSAPTSAVARVSRPIDFPRPRSVAGDDPIGRYGGPDCRRHTVPGTS